MKKLESIGFIFLVAGVLLFLLSFVTLAVVPAMMVKKSTTDLMMPKAVPAEFKEYFSNVDEYKKAIFRGRDHYIREACWHCHSQYVRPVSNESIRYGLVSTAGEYQTDLQLPQLLGTRRVGPDLIRQSGVHSNDWHFAHLYNPRSVVPLSVMPSYRWYFDETGPIPKPKQGAIDIVAYLQWLGSWLSESRITVYSINAIALPPTQE